MSKNDLNRIRRGFIAGAVAALAFALPAVLFAQSSPLTIQPSTGRVGVGTTAPTRTLTVQGTAIVGQSATAPGILLQTNGSMYGPHRRTNTDTRIRIQPAREAFSAGAATLRREEPSKSKLQMGV
jgi:hypothetical protein